MDRDTALDPTGITMATADVMSTAARAWRNLEDRERGDLAHAAGVIERTLSYLWPHIPPETARDVMCIAARDAAIAGTATIPAPLEDMTAECLLEMTAEWLAAHPGHQVVNDAPIGLPEVCPPLAFASSCAFDREEDAETLRTVAVLYAVAFAAQKNAGGEK
jgi:hypothetical protein